MIGFGGGSGIGSMKPNVQHTTIHHACQLHVRPRPIGAERALRGLVGSGGSKVGASKGEGGNRSPRQLELKTLTKSLKTSPSAINCRVCAGDNKWRATRTSSRTTIGQGHALLLFMLLRIWQSNR